MVKRRTTVLGIGALATGSGAAFSSAAFQNSVNPGADFRIIAASDLTVRRGNAFNGQSSADYVVDNYDSVTGVSFDDINPSDLPLAWANSSEDDQLDVQLARLNNSSQVVFEDLIEIANAGDSSESVGIGYFGGYNNTNVDNSTNSSATSGSQVSIKDVQEMFQFEAQAAGNLAFGSDTLISPDPNTWGSDNGGYDNDDDSNAPANYITLDPGDTVQVDVVTDLSGTQTSIIQNATDLGGGDPFQGDTDGFQALKNVLVGTENGGS